MISSSPLIVIGVFGLLGEGSGRESASRSWGWWDLWEVVSGSGSGANERKRFTSPIMRSAWSWISAWML